MDQYAYYTTTEAASALRKSDSWVRKELAAGRLPGEQTKTGRWRIPAQAIDERRERERQQRRDEDAEVVRLSSQIAHIRELEAQVADLQYRLGYAQARIESLQAELEAERSKTT